MEFKRYPVGVQSFDKIIEGNYIYIDKTDLVHSLVNRGAPIFLSRPRRFGKSLLLSTIEAYFLGKRHLFKGLAIDSLTDDWEPHPVFHIDLSGNPFNKIEHLEQHLGSQLEKLEGIYGYVKKELPVSERFALLIEKAYKDTGKRVVVLIDEYDKPLLDTLDDDKKEIHKYYKEVLRGLTLSTSPPPYAESTT